MNSGSLTLISAGFCCSTFVSMHASLCPWVLRVSQCAWVGVWGEGYPPCETIDLPDRASWPGRGVRLNAYGIHVLCVWWGLGGAVLMDTPLSGGRWRRPD